MVTARAALAGVWESLNFLVVNTKLLAMRAFGQITSNYHTSKLEVIRYQKTSNFLVAVMLVMVIVVDMVVIVDRTKLTFKLDFLSNLCLAAFAIVMFQIRL